MALNRPHNRHQKESIEASRHSIAMDGVVDYFAPLNLAESLALMGEPEQA
jgi:hypothetical protein